MGRAIALREDFDGPCLRRLAKNSKDSAQSRRLLALAEIYDGRRRTDAARIGSVGLQVIRDWVLRFNAQGPDGLIDRKAPGQRAKLTDEQRRALARIVEAGPIPAVHGVVRWRRKDLALWIFEEFGISLEESSVGRELRAMGFCRMTARPRHKGQNEYALDDFKKKFPNRGGAGPGRAPARHGHRDLVAGRSQGRTEDQTHAALGQARHPTHGAEGPTHQIGLSLRRGLSGQGRRVRSRAATLQHPGHAMASGRDIITGGTKRPCRPHPRPRRMAHDHQAQCSCQHHAAAITAQGTRVEPHGEHLAVHARQLAVEPHLQIL